MARRVYKFPGHEGKPNRRRAKPGGGPKHNKLTDSWIHLVLGLTRAISESEDVQSALGAALHDVCQATGWDYGEAWIPRPDGAALERSPPWYRRTGDLDRFATLSERFTFLPGVGLPGRV